MKEFKGAKGEWIVVKSPYDADVMITRGETFCVEGNNHCIAITGESEDAESNAQLIAAAPDLLEALQKAVDRQGFTNEELIVARRAINKALGQ